MELAAAVGAVEAVAPVDADEAEHRHIESHADACRVVHLEGLELLDGAPRVAAFEETENVGCDAGAFDDGLAQFEGVAVEDGGTVVGAEAGVLVAAQGHHFAAVEDPRGEAVAADIVASEGREADVAVVVAHISEAEAGVEDHVADEVEHPRTADVNLVVFKPFVAIADFDCRVVLAAEERIGRSDEALDGDFGAAARIDGRIERVAAESDTVGQVVGVAVGEIGGQRGIVVEEIMLVGELLREDEVVVGPFEASRQRHVGAGDLQAIVAGAVLVGPEAVADEVVRNRDAERLGPLAAEPGFGESGAEGIVVRAVGDGVEHQLLSVAGGQRAPSLAVEDVACREVVE